MKLDLRNGDCLEVLKTLQDNSIDSIVTDPPYGLAFMNKHWDYDVPSIDIWKECLRVLKPGGHLLSFGGSRTYHRMACAIEDAGFEIRDQIMWIYGSGFPKSLNVGKSVDKKQGNERKIVGYKKNYLDINNKNEGDTSFYETAWLENKRVDLPNTKGNSEFEGWGTALKPAHEPIVVARKPISEKTIAANVLKWGTGGINIDESRIGKSGGTKKTGTEDCYESNGIYGNGLNGGVVESIEGLGRFPSNLIFDEEAAKLLDEQSGPTSQGHWPKSKTTGFGEFGGGESSYEGVGPKDKNVNKQGASRFFYCAKVSKRERNEGLEGFVEKQVFGDKGGTFQGLSDSKIPSKNSHPTVKPISLMTYLIKLVTPVNGIVLDPFMGSGSTGKAAVREGFSFVGIEREKDYFEIAKARIDYEHNRKTN